MRTLTTCCRRLGLASAIRPQWARFASISVTVPIRRALWDLAELAISYLPAIPIFRPARIRRFALVCHNASILFNSISRWGKHSDAAARPYYDGGLAGCASLRGVVRPCRDA